MGSRPVPPNCRGRRRSNRGLRPVTFGLEAIVVAIVGAVASVGGSYYGSYAERQSAGASRTKAREIAMRKIDWFFLVILVIYGLGFCLLLASDVNFFKEPDDDWVRVERRVA